MASNTSNTALTAAQRVLSTYELLEAILLYTPPIDVFCATRVNRYFRDIVDESSKLQEHLFFQTPLGSKNKKYELNPLFRHLDRDAPFVVRIRIREDDRGLRWCPILSLDRMPKPGSCSSMHLCQPTKGTVVVEYVRPRELRCEVVRSDWWTVRRIDGVRLGDVIGELPDRIWLEMVMWRRDSRIIPRDWGFHGAGMKGWC